ncbi:MAG: hypothetical protein ACRC7N_03135 [Clostridium sp.]
MKKYEQSVMIPSRITALKIILADEPTGSLDKNNLDVVMNILEMLNKEGKTIVIVTHNEEVAKRCNRVIQI